MSDKTTEEAAEALCRSYFEDECGTLILSTEYGFYTTIDVWKSANLIGALYEQQVSILSTTIVQLREENERLREGLHEIAGNIEHSQQDDFDTLRNIAVKVLK